jgi:lipoprotein-anchoring transpeptidase ErfK/SrfK
MVRLYWVGHGRDDRTPVTTFSVIEKLEDPDWFSPDGLIPKGHPDNELGKYFVKFGHQSFTGFGAHEARDPNTVCEQASAGCIRMRLADIADFVRIVPRGSRIEVRATS